MGKRQRQDGAGNIGHGGRATDVSHGFPGQGRPAELPGGGMPRPSSDKDSDAGPFPTRHVLDTVVILEEGNLPHPWFPQCEMIVPWRALNVTVRQGGGAKEAVASRGGAEGEHGEGLRGIRVSDGKIYVFKYLGRVLTAGDYDLCVVLGNLCKGRNSWGGCRGY